jgi:hypothetical protein
MRSSDSIEVASVDLSPLFGGGDTVIGTAYVISDSSPPLSVDLPGKLVRWMGRGELSSEPDPSDPEILKQPQRYKAAPTEKKICSPNGIRTRVATLRERVATSTTF